MALELLIAVEVVHLVVLALWIVLEKRPPLATLAWIFGLAPFPLVGLLVFFLVGPQKLRRAKSRRERAHRRIRASLPDLKVLFDPTLGVVREALPGGLRRVMALGLNACEAPVSLGNAVRILKNGSECFPAMMEAISAARHHVHLEYYIFSPDQIGTRLRELLIERVRAGVQVRLLLDAWGSAGLPSSFLAPLLAAGGEVGWFNPVVLGPRLRPRPNFRTHRKIVLCDGAVAFTGGMNVGDDYAGLDPLRVTRDTHARLEGPAVRALQLLFLEDWNFATGRSITGDPFFAAGEARGPHVVQIAGTGPDREFRAMQQLYFAAITSAEERVRITTPYLIPDDAMRAALVTAGLRGVDVEILVPRRSDSRVVTAAARSYYDELLAAGVRIHEYLPGFLHAKTLIVDGKLALIGTANLNQRSLALDFEVSALLYAPDLAEELEAHFAQDLTVSRELTAESRVGLRFTDRLAEASARLLSPLM